ncbi:uncharacterized protein G2W53_039680 [Senna tora]|uniref:Uncharacterized protein n=1 Tax=Senna tora TaxID=362788 RepID=A0A834SP01_9FABA|nr:uncharacterized protein G2W53_039680 [Senna tora]
MPKSWFDKTTSSTFNEGEIVSKISDISYERLVMKLHLLQRQDSE